MSKVSGMKLARAYFILNLVISMAAPAAEKSIRLPDDNALATLKLGAGVEVVRSNCVACHSTDYIVLQPRVDAKQWGAEVKKMITVFGAPISEPDAKVIVEYLSSAYGAPAKTAPAAGVPNPAKPKKAEGSKQ